jgi:hypothetical protein
MMRTTAKTRNDPETATTAVVSAAIESGGVEVREVSAALTAVEDDEEDKVEVEEGSAEADVDGTRGKVDDVVTLDSMAEEDDRGVGAAQLQ